MGCDLRPADPSKIDPASIPCCGAVQESAIPRGEPAGGAGRSYYQPEDLSRFGEIARVNPQLGDAFFTYYRQAMADGALTRREKALIALALAHALKCPYCIDSSTRSLYEMGVSEA